MIIAFLLHLSHFHHKIHSNTLPLKDIILMATENSEVHDMIKI